MAKVKFVATITITVDESEGLSASGIEDALHPVWVRLAERLDIEESNVTVKRVSE